MDILLPIIGPISPKTEDLITKKIELVKRPEDKIIGYISTHGGEANATSGIIEKISILPIETIVYAGNIVYSSGSVIFSSFKKRKAFEDSKFLIHESIPPKGMARTKIFEDYDAQIWSFMAERLKISFVELKRIAKAGEKMSAKQAYDIGLVNQIISGSWRDSYKKIITQKPGLTL